MPSINAIARDSFPSGIRAGNIKIQGFSVREEPTKSDGTNKENIPVGDSAKLTVEDTEESERSGTDVSAEPGCPNSGSCGRFHAAVPDAQLRLEMRAKVKTLIIPV